MSDAAAVALRDAVRAFRHHARLAYPRTPDIEAIFRACIGEYGLAEAGRRLAEGEPEWFGPSGGAVERHAAARAGVCAFALTMRVEVPELPVTHEHPRRLPATPDATEEDYVTEILETAASLERVGQLVAEVVEAQRRMLAANGVLLALDACEREERAARAAMVEDFRGLYADPEAATDAFYRAMDEHGPEAAARVLEAEPESFGARRSRRGPRPRTGG